MKPLGQPATTGSPHNQLGRPASQQVTVRLSSPIFGCKLQLELRESVSRPP